jgi:hypothetical protein
MVKSSSQWVEALIQNTNLDQGEPPIKIIKQHEKQFIKKTKKILEKKERKEMQGRDNGGGRGKVSIS